MGGKKIKKQYRRLVTKRNKKTKSQVRGLFGNSMSYEVHLSQHVK